MQSYVIDELAAADCKKIQERMQDLGLAGSIDGLFWLPIPSHLLTSVQIAHKESCGPHALALESDLGVHDGGTGASACIRLELLVRATNNLRCDCITKVSPELREHMVNYLDAMLTELEVEF